MSSQCIYPSILYNHIFFESTEALLFYANNHCLLRQDVRLLSKSPISFIYFYFLKPNQVLPFDANNLCLLRQDIRLLSKTWSVSFFFFFFFFFFFLYKKNFTAFRCYLQQIRELNITEFSLTTMVICYHIVDNICQTSI